MTACPVGIGAALGVIGIALALPFRLRLPLFALLPSGAVPTALVSWYPVACAICDLAWAAFVWARPMLSSGGAGPRPA